jgi:hypothetical protein
MRDQDAAAFVEAAEARHSSVALPGKASFNENPIVYANVEKIQTGQPPDMYHQGGRNQQRGSGRYTLCEL